jgi:hypothetical protein
MSIWKSPRGDFLNSFLAGDGQLLIIMINSVVGIVVHASRRRYDLDQLERGIGHEEAKGSGTRR